MAALIAAATTALTIPVPATRGYFNLGDLMVYTAAVLMGPLVGGVAGGIGSALSDTYLGYYAFAPGTLVIKGIEGLIVGLFCSRRESPLVKKRWKEITLAMSAALFLLLALMASYYFTGGLVFGMDFIGTIGGAYSYSAYLDAWLVGAFLLSALVAYRGMRSDPSLGWTTLSIVVGGAEMITGYFLYEVLVLREGVLAASVEVPVNLAQLVFGLLGSLFLTGGVTAFFRRPAAQARRPQPP
jgi:uncharacterized membrane protein